VTPLPEQLPPPERDKPINSPAMSILDAQIALARQGICSGCIDGALGTQTRAALRAFQRREGIAVTGSLDAETRAHLVVTPPLHTVFVVASSDLARLQPVKTTWLEKSEQTALDYETILELAAEKGHAHPALIRKLNPGVTWSNIVAGQRITIPQVEYPSSNGKAALIRIHLEEKSLEVFNAQSNLLAHFPCSIAARVEKRPVGELHVKTVAWNPNYTFDPAIFPESAEGRELGRKLLIPPGPNNPVGVAWIGLDRPGYGIHGTPRPEDVGRTESHGCFRLANWNAEFLARMVRPGIPVVVEP
jgi:lipoprotein-anchoring transpeptidase ErfK/SrfK